MQDGISWLETTLTCVKRTRGHEGTRLETRHTCHANTVARQLRYFSRLSLRLKAEPATPCNMHGLSEATAVTTTVSGHSSQIDAVLLMFRFKAQALRERRPCQCRTSRVSWRKWGEEQRRNKEMEAKRERKREMVVEDRMKRGRLDLCCLCLFENKACHCALCACSGQTEAEMADRKGAAVAECAHWRGKQCLILVRHNKTIRGRAGHKAWLFCSSDIMRWLCTPGVTQRDGSLLCYIPPPCHRPLLGRLPFVDSALDLTDRGKFPVTTSCSNSLCRCSTDTGHCLRWKGSPASSPCRNPASERIRAREMWRFVTFGGKK